MTRQNYPTLLFQISLEQRSGERTIRVREQFIAGMHTQIRLKLLLQPNTDTANDLCSQVLKRLVLKSILPGDEALSTAFNAVCNTDTTSVSTINSVAETQKEMVKLWETKWLNLTNLFNKIKEVNISEVVGSTEPIINHDFQIGNTCHGASKLIIGIRHSTDAEYIETPGEKAPDPDLSRSLVHIVVYRVIFSLIASIIRKGSLSTLLYKSNPKTNTTAAFPSLQPN